MRETKEEKREKVLQAASKLILHYGFAKTTMQDIAAEAGMSVGSLYNFFKSKEDICEACAESFKTAVVVGMEDVASSELSPREKLKAVMLLRNLSTYEHFSETPHGMEIVTAMLPRMDGIMKRFARMEAAVIEKIINEGVARGDFFTEDVKEAALTFLEAFSRYCPPLSIGMTEAEISEGTKRMAAMFTRALSTRKEKVAI